METNSNYKTKFNSNRSLTKKYNFNYKCLIWYFENIFRTISQKISCFNEETISSRKDIYSERNPIVAYNRFIRMFYIKHTRYFFLSLFKRKAHMLLKRYINVKISLKKSKTSQVRYTTIVNFLRVA